jgi:hypothetical protein
LKQKRFLYLKVKLKYNAGIREEVPYEEICATGGGAYKFYNIILQELEIKLDKHDELLSLVRGYIAMNYYTSSYEHLGDGVVNYLPPEDLVI